jgi:hypothetical protein
MKVGKQQCKLTWWDGSNEDHQLIIKNNQKYSPDPYSLSHDSKGMSTLETHPNHSNIVPLSKSKDSTSLDPGIEIFKASYTLDMRIESKVLPNSPPP